MKLIVAGRLFLGRGQKVLPLISTISTAVHDTIGNPIQDMAVNVKNWRKPASSDRTTLLPLTNYSAVSRPQVDFFPIFT